MKKRRTSSKSTTVSTCSEDVALDWGVTINLGIVCVTDSETMAAAREMVGATAHGILDAGNNK